MTKKFRFIFMIVNMDGVMIGIGKGYMLMLIPAVALAVVAAMLIMQSITAQVFENVEIHAQVIEQDIIDSMKVEDPAYLDSAVVLNDEILSKMPTVKKALLGAIDKICTSTPGNGCDNGYSSKISRSEVDLLFQLARKQMEGTDPYRLETTDYPSGQPVTITSEAALVKYKEYYFLIFITRVG